MILWLFVPFHFVQATPATMSWAKEIYSCYTLYVNFGCGTKKNERRRPYNLIIYRPHWQRNWVQMALRQGTTRTALNDCRSTITVSRSFRYHRRTVEVSWIRVGWNCLLNGFSSHWFSLYLNIVLFLKVCHYISYCNHEKFTGNSKIYRKFLMIQEKEGRKKKVRENRVLEIAKKEI